VTSPAELGREDAVLVRRGLRHALVLPERAAGWDHDAAETLRRACVAASLPASAWRGEAAVLAFHVTPLDEEREVAP
jgi:AMMECR1 domain-containing protein